MPYEINGQTVIFEVSNSPEKMLIEKIQALSAEVTTLEKRRDAAIEQAANENDAALARAAMQMDVDRARERLTQAEQELTQLGEQDNGNTRPNY